MKYTKILHICKDIKKLDRMAAPEASSSSSSSSRYEVFLSFHGKDVRTNFADHLYNALVYAGILTFRDSEELHKGNKIGPELLVAIQQSRISIPIFSENYASSKWCLNELSKIFECKRTMDQIVLPIFYKVEPRDVRNQIGSYATAFEEHQMHFNETTVQMWKDALREVGELGGWDSRKELYEAELVKKIVKTVWSTLNKRPLIVPNNLVGIQSHIRKFLMLLDVESDDKKIVGIHGLGGIGKTTIARAVYNIVFHHFEGCSFIENVHENSQKHGLPYLQNQLIFDILKQENRNVTSVDDGINVIQQRFCQRKVLIVLDDVHQDNQAKSLVGDREWVGIGSKIIITSRNKDVLNAQKVDEIYQPNVMDLDDSLKLFSHYAFRRDQPLEDYLDLSEAMVKMTGGLPLALQVIGSSLFLKEKSVWKGMLKKLQKVPNDDVMKRLKISYDGLDDEEQQMFLDTACFFIGMNKDIACHIWDGCGFSSQVGLDALCAKSLVTISEDGELRMHDQIQDLGREIVRQESIKEPGKRTRIWSQEEVMDVLITQMGTSNVEGLIVDFRSRLKSQYLMNEGFSTMTKLRLIQVDYAQFSGNFTHSFSELRWLSWKGCPDQYTLINFCPRRLAVLDLSFSEITKNWMGWNYIKMAVNLKVLSLTSCHQLAKSPDLAANRHLEILFLGGCKYLVEINKSIGYLKKLVILDMSGCENLVVLPNEICHLASLKRLNLKGCMCLSKLPEKLDLLINLKTLDLSGCESLVDLPIEICQLISLERLDLSGCKSLIKLPEKLGLMINLLTLDLSGCEKLDSLSNLPRHLEVLILKYCKNLVEIDTSIGYLNNLVLLDMRCCFRLMDLPIENCHLTSLKRLDLWGCMRLNKLPKQVGHLISLTSLTLSCCENLVDLPIEICQLTSLETLDLSLCERLVDLPSEIYQLVSLKSLDLRKCGSLIKLPEKLGCMISLTRLLLGGCQSLMDLPVEIFQLISLERLDLSGCKSQKKLPEKLDWMTSLTRLDISGCHKLESIPNLPSSLKFFDASDCESIILLPVLSTLENLEVLCLGGCKKLLRISSLPSRLIRLDVSNCSSIRYISNLPSSLSSLDAKSCKSIVKLSSSSGLRNLERLFLDYCDNLEEIEGVDEEGLESLVLFTTCCRSLIKLPILRSSKKLRKLTIKGSRVISNFEGEGMDSLEELEIGSCRSLKKIPNFIDSLMLRKLEIDDCPKLSKIESLEHFKSLQTLTIYHAPSLKILPDVSTLKNLSYFSISQCFSMERLPDLSKLKKLQVLTIEDCGKLTEILGLDRLVSLRELNIKGCISIERLLDLSQLKNLDLLNIEGCKKLTEIYGVDRLEFLENLDISGCESLERLPDLSNLKNLKQLIAIDCKKLTEIKADDGLESLKFLEVWGCGSLEKLPDLANLKKLREVNGERCWSPTEIADVCRFQVELLIRGGCTKLQLDFSNLTHAVSFDCT